MDGQGGGIGRAVIQKLREALSDEIEIIALGTNTTATLLMIKAGANDGASGENPILYNAGRVDFIIGVIGIIAANSMLGEITPNMARAISESPAKKILIPLNNNGIEVAGSKNEILPHLINSVARSIEGHLNELGYLKKQSYEIRKVI